MKTDRVDIKNKCIMIMYLKIEPRQGNGNMALSEQIL